MNAAIRKVINSTTKEVKTYIFESAGHSDSGFQRMWNLQQLGKFCDITINVGGNKYFAHKVILAAVSQYFQEILDGDDKLEECRTNEVYIRGMSTLAFDLILEFIYTGKMTITSENIEDLLMASKLLKIDNLEAACWDSVQNLLSPSNWHKIKTFAGLHHAAEVSRKCYEYALQHFTEISESVAFLQLRIDEVRQFVVDHKLVLSSEEKMYSAVLKWVKHDLANRKNYLFELMKDVKFLSMDKAYFMKNVIRESLLRDDLGCANILIETTEYHAGVQPAPSSSRTLPRDHFKKRGLPYIFATGGDQGHGLASMECEAYNPRSNRWHCIAPMQIKRKGHAVIGFGQFLYAFGGWNDNDQALSSVEYYDPGKDTWTLTTSMPHERAFHGISTINNSIFIGGGENKDKHFSTSVVNFDPPTDVYKNCLPMNSKRADFKMAATDVCIYAIGGWGSHSLCTVERFDPREGKWSTAPSMATRRYQHGVTVFKDYIYCTGGRDSSITGERFDIRRDAWEPIPNMLEERWGHELVALDGCIYSIGGNSVERLDPDDNRWIELPSMLKERLYVGASILDGFEIKHPQNLDHKANIGSIRRRED